MRHLLGVDIGTSGCKCVVLDEHGATVAIQSVECNPDMHADGTVEQHPDDWYSAMVECLQRVVRDDGVDLHTVAALSITGQMQGITLIGVDGSPVRNSILWNDTRCAGEVDELNEKHSRLFTEKVNFATTTGLSVSKIEWLRKNEPDSWAKTDKFVFASNYICFRLTDRIVVDENNVTHSGLNDTKNNSWSPELISACNVEESKIPELVGCFDVVGTVTDRASDQTGLSAGIPVIAGGGDAAVENYSISTVGKSRMKIRLGTAASLNGVVPLESVKDRAVWPGIRDIRRGYLLTGGYTMACAASIKWVRDVFYSEQPSNSSTYSVMDEEAITVPLGSDGLLYHPYLVGESLPYFSSSLRAKFNGMNIGHRRPHFMRAVYEGVSFSIRDGMLSVKEFDDVEEVVVVGGGTKSDIWISILRDILGRDVILMENCDAGYGAALMAGEGAGILDAETIILRDMENSRRLEFDRANHEAYAAIFDRYRDLAQK